MRPLKILGGVGALLAAAVVGGAMISAALAGTTDPTPTPTSATTNTGGLAGSTYAEAYLDALAAELGVERSALGPAALAATQAAIDAAVEAGDLDEEIAQDLEDRLAALEDPETLLLGHGGLRGPGIGGPGWHHGRLPGFVGGLSDAIDAAAQALGLEREELVAAVHDGDSLQGIADAQGVDYATVTQAVVDSVQATLDEAIANGDLDQDGADEILARLESWLAEGGDPGAPMGLHLGHHGPHGPRF